MLKDARMEAFDGQVDALGLKSFGNDARPLTFQPLHGVKRCSVTFAKDLLGIDMTDMPLDS